MIHRRRFRCVISQKDFMCCGFYRTIFSAVNLPNDGNLLRLFLKMGVIFNKPAYSFRLFIAVLTKHYVWKNICQTLLHMFT